MRLFVPSKRKPRAKLNEKDYKDISELYKNGNSAREIAEAYGCSEGTVYRILSANGVTPNKKKKDAVKEQHFATTPIQEPIQEPIKEDIHDQVQNHSSMKVYQIGIYEGVKGTFKVNLTEHTVELPDFPKCIGKDELEVYIRDLLIVWREM